MATQLVKHIVTSQLFLIGLAFILAYAPGLYLVAILLYIGVMLALQLLLGRGVRGKEAREIMESRLLFREDAAEKVMLGDKMLVEEYTAIAKANVLPYLLPIPLYIALFYVLPMLLTPILSQQGLSGLQLEFLKWLLTFEAVFGVSYAIRPLFTRKYGSPTMLITPRAFEVREKGLVLYTGFKPIVLKLPLDERYKVRVDERRGFVEIRDSKGNTLIRLYTRRLSRLKEVLAKLGVLR